MSGLSVEERNKKYEANQNNGVRSLLSRKPYTFINGTIPVMISAPHAVRQTRNDAVKAADAYTGGMAEYLCELTGAHGQIRFFNEGSDPNFDSDGLGKDYRDEMVKYCKKNGVKLVLDLHGMAMEDYICIIGTNEYKNLCGNKKVFKTLKSALERIGKVGVDEDNKCASGACTVSRYVAEKSGIPCIQLEIASSYRKEYERREKLMKVLAEFVEEVE